MSTIEIETIKAVLKKATKTQLCFEENKIEILDITFQKRVSFKNLCFATKLDLSRCHFEKGVEFIGCVFKKEFIMVAAHVIGDCQFRACIFEEHADFDRLEVDGKLEVRAPKDKNGLIDDVDGKKFKIEPFVVFKKGARFSQLHVTGEANFGSAQFWDWADFYNANIEGAAFFRVDYCKKYRDTKNNTEYFEDSCFVPVAFKKGVRFRFAQFGNELNFHGATFLIEETTVYDANLVGTLDERERLRNKWRVDFSFITCKGIVFFCDPTEQKYNCIFETKLDSKKTQLDFEGASFEKTVRFVNAQFPNKVDDKKERLVSFQDCSIKGDLEFRGTLPTNLCLSGCTYKRIHVKDFDELIQAIKNWEITSGIKYDRRSWMQFESTLRAEGFVEEANNVYVKRRESRHETLKGITKFFDSCLNCLTRYGTGNIRMGLIVVGIILIFAGLFATIGKFKTENDNKKAEYVVGFVRKNPDNGVAAHPYSHIIEISLEQFLPFKIPMNHEYKPVGIWTSLLAIIEKLLGWFLIPLLVANLSGFLHNKAKPQTNGDNN